MEVKERAFPDWLLTRCLVQHTLCLLFVPGRSLLMQSYSLAKGKQQKRALWGQSAPFGGNHSKVLCLEPCVSN